MKYDFYLMNHTGFTLIVPISDQHIFIENGRSLKTTFRPELKSMTIDNAEQYEIEINDEFATFEGHTVICYRLYG